jgi:hypothetical protein
MPQTSPVQRRSILKSGIALSPGTFCHKGSQPGKATRLALVSQFEFPQWVERGHRD